MTTAPVELERPEEDLLTQRHWRTIVWDDPINLMSYVTWVFQRHFGYPREKAHRLMLDVHERGKAVVSTGSRDDMERDVSAMHGYGLWATLSQDSDG